MSSPPAARHATPPQAWLDALARAREDIAAGRTEDFETVMRALEAEDADRTADAKTTHERTRAAAR